MAGRRTHCASAGHAHRPEAAGRLHWKMYPQSRPAGSDDARVLKDAILIQGTVDVKDVAERTEPPMKPGTWIVLAIVAL